MVITLRKITFFKFFFVLEHFRKQNETLCQRVSQSVTKWPRKTRKKTHTHNHFRIYISRDITVSKDIKHSTHLTQRSTFYKAWTISSMIVIDADY